ncbi:outer membrane protein assembly factor BamB family protein [Halosimplex halophilum]|uniref:outer membrane protein assembly factor BamB family protein n=1 Tax=Halosimplex halophilum TaxID=2559572 RepID=UPI00107EEB27|nr:PQQ-binding-like beta-propeller repeat protein [Halosimplex halophilum]
MAQVSTATPTAQIRERRPGIPDDGDGNIAGELDLSTYEGFAFLSSFVIPGGCSFSYDSSGPSLSIGAGRIARYTGDRQELVTVEAVSGLGLASGTTNFVYFRGDNVWEVRDADEPPGPDALLAGTVDTASRRVDEAVRGRSPIPSDLPGVATTGDGPDEPPAVVDAPSLVDGETRYYRERITETERIALYRAGVVSDTLSATTGLAARVVTEGGGTVHHATEAKRATGDPLATVSGPADVRFEISNATGGSVAGVSGRWTYRIEPVSAPTTVSYGGFAQYQVDAQNTGATANTGPTGSSSQAWTYTTGSLVQASPAVVDGTVYVGSRDASMYALATSDGSEEWSTGLGSGILSSAAVVDGTVYVGAGSTLYALSAADGSEEWTYATGNTISSSPAVVDGTVYVGSNDDSVYAVAASDGSEQWTYATGGDVVSSPAVANGTVYVGSNDSTVYALDASDGSEVWTVATGNEVRSSPAVVDGTVYVGSFDDTVYALDAGDGSETWSTALGGDVFVSPSVRDGSVFAATTATGQNNVFALAASDGSQEWAYQAADAVQSSPTVTSDTVYFGDGSGNVYGLAVSDGSENWTASAGSFLVWSPPALDSGRLFIGSGDNNVYALE